MMSKQGKTLIFALVLAGVAGAFWLAVRNFPRPELQKDGKESATAEPSDHPKGEEIRPSRSLRREVLTLASLLADDDQAKAQMMAAEVGTTASYGKVMELFTRRKPGEGSSGLGVGQDPGKIHPDGIEAMLHILERDGPGAIDIKGTAGDGVPRKAISLVLAGMGSGLPANEPKVGSA